MLTATLANVRARTSSVALEVSELRVAALALCAADALFPLVPFYPGITCPLRAATGIPCPLCGLSGSIRAALRLDVAESWSLNPGGLATLGAALVLLFTRRPLI